ERFRHDEAHHCLEGQSSGTVYGMGDDVEVEIREADPVTGGLVLAITRHRPLERTGRGRDRGGRGRPHQAPRRGPGRHGGARRRG
ncbi:MAG: hypothetical protein RL477_898, partial [Pseudomonadota bacterium]